MSKNIQLNESEIPRDKNQTHARIVPKYHEELKDDPSGNPQMFKSGESERNGVKRAHAHTLESKIHWRALT
ncbi:MAG: hypothetical protein ACLFTH_01910 [Candidatus Woesearchaeota archaeon]